MTHDPLTPGLAENERRVLEYRPSKDDKAFHDRDTWYAVVAAILSAVAAAGTIFIFLVANIQLGPIVPVVAVIVALTPLAAVAWYRWSRLGSARFLIGMLIGLGVAGLVEGLCFMTIR